MTDTPERGEMTYTRVYDAPAELVFVCMTTPEHLCHFWGPTGMTTPLENITVDLRPGGVFETTMVDDTTGEEYPMTGVFVVIDPPSKLVFSESSGDSPITTTIHFRDLGGRRTEVVTHQTNIPTMFTGDEARAGMESSFDKFAAYVTPLAARAG